MALKLHVTNYAWSLPSSNARYAHAQTVVEYHLLRQDALPFDIERGLERPTDLPERTAFIIKLNAFCPPECGLMQNCKLTDLADNFSVFALHLTGVSREPINSRTALIQLPIE